MYVDLFSSDIEQILIKPNCIYYLTNRDVHEKILSILCLSLKDSWYIYHISVVSVYHISPYHRIREARSYVCTYVYAIPSLLHKKITKRYYARYDTISDTISVSKPLM